jgi:tRNA modification GTPase
VFSTTDTIVAIATPPGRGGLGVVRLSGPAAHSIACTLIARRAPLAPRHATFGNVRQTETAGGSTAIDQVVVVHFPAPASYTGDDVVEVSAHGSPVILRTIVASSVAAGARLAEPGEFTLRAFMNGRMDLMQAEAVADLIDAVTPLQARAAFDQLQGTLTRSIAAIEATLFDLIARLEASVDFPEEGYHFLEPSTLVQRIDETLERMRAILDDAGRGRLVREGLQIAIIGRPNVGKSSLFNALVGSARAIVTDRAGTTRDLVTETIDLDGLRVTLVDTAGVHETSDAIEAEGVRRAMQSVGVSDVTILVLDGSKPPEDPDHRLISQIIENKSLIAINKSDAGQLWTFPGAVSISAVTGDGLSCLRARLFEMLDVDLVADRPAITNMRHIGLVRRAREALDRAREAVLEDSGAISEEFVLADLQEARSALEEVTGRRAPEELLNHIFSRFCIGK